MFQLFIGQMPINEALTNRAIMNKHNWLINISHTLVVIKFFLD